VSLLQGISDAIRGVVDGVMGSSLNFITQTPPAGTYDSPTVKSLWEAVRTVMNAGLAIVALWGGFNLIVRDQIGSPYHEAMELVPRLVIGALLANTSLSWAQLAIDANNALCQGIGQVSLPAWEHADSTTQLLINVIATLIYLVTGLVLLLQMLMRLALIDVLLRGIHAVRPGAGAEARRLTADRSDAASSRLRVAQRLPRGGGPCPDPE